MCATLFCLQIFIYFFWVFFIIKNSIWDLYKLEFFPIVVFIIYSYFIICLYLKFLFFYHKVKFLLLRLCYHDLICKSVVTSLRFFLDRYYRILTYRKYIRNLVHVWLISDICNCQVIYVWHILANVMHMVNLIYSENKINM